MAEHRYPLATPDNTLCVVLAGGQGQRMGGLDKGLQPYQDQPLAAHMLARLRQQTWSPTLHIGINANRHLAQYAAWGYPVWPDRHAGHHGPLEGLLSSLQQAHQMQAGFHYLLAVPCDTPHLPLDLAARLAATLHATHKSLAAARAAGRAHPLACLLSLQLMPELETYLDSGQRKVQTWMDLCDVQWVDFDGPGDAPGAFDNFNRLADLSAAGPVR